MEHHHTTTTVNDGTTTNQGGLYPSVSSSLPEQINPFHQSSSQPPPSQHQPPAPQQPPPQQPPATAAENQFWGTHVMGTPAIPSSNPENKKAASLYSGGGGSSGEAHQAQSNPYLQCSPTEKPGGNSPLESVLHVFNSWSNKAETLANNIWHNLKTGSSVQETAWGKMNLTAKALTGGGFETLYKQVFTTYENEKLKKTFACYLSTSTGPVAGTLYLSTVHAAFCSDRPLCFSAPSGQQTWSYYKVMIPLAKIGAINPVVMRDNPSSERYLQLVTIDGHDFWFMGFVNFEKASKHLTEAISSFSAHGIPVPPGTNNH
ncbi:hypothetical protein ACFE04_010109 [Oxalis oulophora]